jgi:hypothetical protein
MKPLYDAFDLTPPKKVYAGLRKIISGGQTGADQAGLIAAFNKNVLTGGTAPAGWATSAGPNPLLQVLGLRAHGTLKTRTEQNIKDSDGTVILTQRSDSPGSVLTRNLCKKLNRPFLDLDLGPLIAHRLGAPDVTGGTSYAVLGGALYTWLLEHEITTLNVAGNRELNGMLLITETATVVVEVALSMLDLDGLIVRE